LTGSRAEALDQLVLSPVFKAGVGRESVLGGFDSRAFPLEKGRSSVTRFRLQDEEKKAHLRALPAVGTILAWPLVAAAVERHGHAVVRRAARETLAAARLDTKLGSVVTEGEVVARAESLSRGTLRAVINATGVLIHTNLGRSPLAAEALADVQALASGYSTLEYDLSAGFRGERHVHAHDLLVELTGAEDGIVVNNNAAAVLLVLTTLASGREVVVSRGELVEIGGGFRIPDVLTQSGARLVEIGTTNRTHDRDYARAIGAWTALVLKVHRSNFAMLGFTSEVPLARLAEISHARGIPVICDAGSGCLVDTGPLAGVEPTIAGSIRDGADVVTFSGDKLLGGPQAGIIVGATRYIEPMRRHPLMRALRADKLCLAALHATLRLWRDAPARLPLMRLLGASPSELADRCEGVLSALTEAIRSRTKIVTTVARIGGGSSPAREIESRGLRIVVDDVEAWSLGSVEPSSPSSLASRTAPPSSTFGPSSPSKTPLSR
jgi:L-seryl-tRNA(Ser) seleniumtransferase